MILKILINLFAGFICVILAAVFFIGFGFFLYALFWGFVIAFFIGIIVALIEKFGNG
jgi:hypothetical protein